MERKKGGKSKRSCLVWGRRAALPPLLSISAHLECKCGFLYRFLCVVSNCSREKQLQLLHSLRERKTRMAREG